jgi:hypothetical protein
MVLSIARAMKVVINIESVGALCGMACRKGIKQLDEP